MSVKGSRVSCRINGTEVGSCDKADLDRRRQARIARRHRRHPRRAQRRREGLELQGRQAVSPVVILDTLVQSGRYAGLHPCFARAFDFLKTTPLASLAPGRHEIDDDRLYRARSISRTDAATRAHGSRRIAGTSTFSTRSTETRRSAGCRSRPASRAGGFDTEKDIAFFDERAAACGCRCRRKRSRSSFRKTRTRRSPDSARCSRRSSKSRSERRAFAVRSAVCGLRSRIPVLHAEEHAGGRTPGRA